MTILDFAIRLAVVILIGIVIGIERQLTGHQVGMKTTVLIAIGSLSFIMVDIMLGSDDTRMAAQIISGIGFLCSGVIFKTGLNVNGLNTAATLWGTAAISILAGYGHLVYAGIATGLLVVFNLLLTGISKYVKPIPKFIDAAEDGFYINVVCMKSDVQTVKELISQNIADNIILDSIQTSLITADKYRVKAKLNANVNQTNEIDLVTNKIFEAGVFSVTWERAED